MAVTDMTDNHQMAPAEPLPSEVDIDQDNPPRHTPREMEMVEAMAGKPFTELTVGQGERAMVWFQLRRLGFQPTWDDAADVLVSYVQRDPTTAGNAGEPSSISPGSAITGE